MGSRTVSFAYRLLYSLLFITLLSSCKQGGLSPGELAPDFSLSTLQGDEVSLSRYRGKIVLLNFWASWCPPCLQEMPSLEALYKSYRDQNFTVLTVASRDQLEDVLAIKDKFDLTLPILLDEEGSIAAQYKTTGFPESFLIDAGGRILMFNDPEGGEPTARVIGPRDWSKQTMKEMLQNVIAESSMHR